ncbi:sulfate permease [Purpureocillium lavendulum]|uniref:Sulfate permease n=1 Tax=Purpureocillium lavendulum TaxID=1247861 RepID=A0AB34G2J8_9HYPO|nr:sulfate permease [Purpureocillium lavendulum]
MPTVADKVGHSLATVLGIKLQGRDVHAEDDVPGGGFAPPTDRFIEERVATSEWIRDQLPSPAGVVGYARSLFPCLGWLPHYNLRWLTGDIIAGLTVGAIIVPQGMAYASLAKVEPQFGLYSSFMGLVIYWMFGTSKDISIGPVAVLASIVGSVVESVQSTPAGKDTAGHIIASSFSLVAGVIVLGLGLLRCGWIIDLMSITCLAAFTTGSSLSIIASQLPALLGIRGVRTRDAPYKVYINTFKRLPSAQLDAAMGLTALFGLYLIRYCLNKAADRYPKHKRAIYIANTMRNVFVILLYTMVSWLVNMNRRSKPAFRIVGKIPTGFHDVAVPHLDAGVISSLVSHLPAGVIVMLVEHIAVAKAFGRISDYSINPSQEMVAIGMTNILGPFLGAFASTGSFSRTTVNSKAGVRTPAASLISGLVVLVAAYCLTRMFFYIPYCVLAAVIMHALGDLITSPNTLYQFWRVSPLEVLIFFVGVFVSVFKDIEEGVYATVGMSAGILIYRILRARGSFLGKARVHSVLGDQVVGDDPPKPLGEYRAFEDPQSAARTVFLPLDHGDGSNPSVALQSPYPGVFIYRFSDGFNYPNANRTLDHLTDFIFANTRRTSPEQFDHPGDRPWNRPAPRESHDDRLPTLKAVILDFSCVNNIDITSVQCLIDVRNQLDQYTAPEVVDWHVACINNRWAKRALASGGFGIPSKTSDGMRHRWKSIFSVAEIEGESPTAAMAGGRLTPSEIPPSSDDEESSTDGLEGFKDKSSSTHIEEKPVKGMRKGVMIHSLDKPMFHVDLTSALQNAIVNVEASKEVRPPTEGN